MSARLFQQFRSNLSVKNVGDVSSAYASITARLNKDFWQQDSDAYHRRQVGSYGRRTAIDGISDLDMIFELPWSVYEQYKNYAGNGPSQLLQAVRKSLLVRYPRTEIKGDGQVVVIEFNKFVVEVLPAFVDKECDGYRFGDANNGGSWKTCKPLHEIAAVDSKNDATNRNLKHVCKMLRAWKNRHGVNMGGMLIDTLAYNFFGVNNKYNEKSYASYGALFVELFEYLSALEHQDYWMAPGSGQRVQSKGKFQPKAKKAAAKCQKALEADSEKRQAKLWRDVFGPAFPLEIAVMAKAESELREGVVAAGGEQFIENIFPVDIREDLAIDCDVSERDKTNGKLRRMAAFFPWLPLGRTLRFHVAECSVPEPYDLYWKVRNVGPEAERRGMIRGQISLDEGKEERRETTSFQGPHFVEAYVVKNGVCVARDTIDVAIGEH